MTAFGQPHHTKVAGNSVFGHIWWGFHISTYLGNAYLGIFLQNQSPVHSTSLEILSRNYTYSKLLERIQQRRAKEKETGMPKGMTEIHI